MARTSKPKATKKPSTVARKKAGKSLSNKALSGAGPARKTAAAKPRPSTVAAKEPKVTPALVAAHGLKRDEYERIEKLIGRTPSFTELGIFSAMWNEHCSYKSSKIHLRTLPTKAS